MRAGSLALSALLALWGCGDGTATDGGGTPVGCSDDETELLDGSCASVAIQNNGCLAGTALYEGICEPAGVPASRCADGFVADGDGACLPILPPEPCPPGLIAIPGDTSCRELVDCGAGPWGAIPVEPSTLYVDANASGVGPDGSPAQPFTTINEAIAVAPEGAMIAIAAGVYSEQVDAFGKSLRLWGRCPSMVEVAAPIGGLALIGGDANSFEAHNLAITGGAVTSVVITGVISAVLDGLWVHDGDTLGLLLTDEIGPVDDVLVSNCLVEDNVGVLVDGVVARIERSLFRDNRAASNVTPVPLILQRSQHTGARQPTTLDHVVVERGLEGLVNVFGTDATITASVFRDALAIQDAPWGSGLLVQEDDTTLIPGTLNVYQSLIERAGLAGLVATGADVIVEDTTFQDGLVVDTPIVTLGHGIFVQPGEPDLTPSTLTARRVRIRRHADMGVAVSGAAVYLEGVWVSDMRTRIDGAFGHGVDITPFQGIRGAATIVGSRVTRSLGVGISSMSSDMYLDGVLVEDTLANPTSNRGGIGVLTRNNPEGQHALLTALACQVDRSREFGIFVSAGHADVTSTLVSDVADDGGAFGDALAALFSTQVPVSMNIQTSVLRRAARGGLVSFGAEIELGQSEIQCATVPIAREPIDDELGSVVDLGGNRCGCGDAIEECKAQSASLQPPAAPEL
jgi:hypothetical protein